MMSSSLRKDFNCLIFFFTFFTFLLTQGVDANDDTHRYVAGEPVVVWVSSVTPYHNPSEVYSISDLPLCTPERLIDSPHERAPHLGELLIGSALQNSDIDVRFLRDVPKTKLCSVPSLSDDSSRLLAYAVSNHYLSAYLVDDLPVYAMIGELVLDEKAVEELERNAFESPHGIADDTFIYTHKSISIGYSGDQIVSINMTVENPEVVKAGAEYDLTYSVAWTQVDDIHFNDRFNRYIDQDLRRTQVRWFGVINSALMAMFLCGTVALILLRTLRADFARYIRDEEEGGDGGGSALLDKAMGDETGWKLVSGDVFRRPQNIVLYSALVGVGSHLFMLAVLVLLASLAGSLHVDRGAVLKAGVFGYALTSIVSGFFSGAFYRGLMPASPQQGPGHADAAEDGNRDWMRVMVLSALIFPALCVSVAILLSVVALSYGTSSYISLWTIMKLAAVWCAVSLPLTVVGTMWGRRNSVSAPPFRVVHVPRPVPLKPWYLNRTFLCIAAGFLPFGSVFVEIYYVATSAWGHAIYAAWTLFLVVLLILAMVVTCVSIVSVYLQLNAEDHYWHWHSFFSGASVSIYVFLYALYFFLYRTEMSGVLQASFYFGYTFIACSALAILGGTIGTVSSSVFVRAIYSSIKND
jgi:transmembrane 9 superfamily member 3